MRAWVYHDPRLFNCGDCDRTPRLYEANGWCGTKQAPGLLPLKVGPPMTTCPRGVGLSDRRAIFVGNLLPTPWRSSPLEGFPSLLLPPFWRSALRLAGEWIALWNKEHAPRKRG